MKLLEKKVVSQCISSDYCRGWNDAVDAMPRWISVEERLPERGERVLLLHQHMCDWEDGESTLESIVITGCLKIAYGYKRKLAWRVHPEEYDIGYQKDFDYAAYWMPLPEAPKEEK